MTDKQIIIDDQKNTIHRLQQECTEKTNAIIALGEQLKRKEQECEELKIYIESNEQQVKEVETLVMDNDRLINELDQLKAENDELKKKCNIYTCGICGNKEDCNKLYKTLTEIKEIAEKYNNTHLGEQQYCCKDILQKISECEVNND